MQYDFLELDVIALAIILRTLLHTSHAREVHMDFDIKRGFFVV